MLFISVVTLLPSCGTIYHISGHNSSNASSPPDITMLKGEKKRVLTSGFERLGVCAPPDLRMRVEDRGIVDIQDVDWVAYLVAKNTGTTRVQYLPGSDGFLVHVIDTQKADSEQGVNEQLSRQKRVVDLPVAANLYPESN